MKKLFKKITIPFFLLSLPFVVVFFMLRALLLYLLFVMIKICVKNHWKRCGIFCYNAATFIFADAVIKKLMQNKPLDKKD